MGQYFAKHTLHEIGYRFQLGHNGKKCPATGTSPLDIPLIIVAINGIHTVTVVPCSCSDNDLAEQLFDTSLFPATLEQPRTAFTFEVLDYFLQDYSICKMSAFLFYDKLKHITNPVNPDSLPVSLQILTL
jgi:hypothetical protein